MTSKTLDWLNSNRFRAYPFVNDRGIIVNGARIPDCVLLDCMVMDTRDIQDPPELIFTGITVEETYTDVFFSYGDIKTSYRIGSDPSSIEGTFVKVRGRINGDIPSRFVQMRFVFSSPSYIYNSVGTGSWQFNGKVLPTKVVSVKASGVSGIKTNGSLLIQGAGTATGDVHLVDGCRTQPGIKNGKVIVQVGTKYGEDPCWYKKPPEESENVDCSDLMLFFCGQNAINSGDVSISGGPGVNVTQGRKYTAKHDIIDTYGKVGISAGESVPCIEIVATTDLLNIYRPSEDSSAPSWSSNSPQE